VSGNGILIVTVALLAAATGMAWERARTALRNLEKTRRALGTLQITARREQGRAGLYIIIAALVIYVMVRHG
jgi:hypothetical protein